MDERSEITNRRRWRRPLGAVAATAAAAVVVSTATAGGIALLRRRGGGGNSNGRNSNSNNGFDRGHLRRRVLQGNPTDGPVFVYEPFIITLPTTGMGFSDPSPRTHNDPPPHTDPAPPHTDPMDEFFPPPHTDPVPPHTDPMDEFYDPPPPHTDPADDFENLFCADDPEFRYDFKGSEVSCGSLRGDRRSMALCRKELDGGEILGIRSCPETCGMVDECLAAASGLGEGRGGGGKGPGGGEGGGGKGPTAVLRTKYWWPSFSHCVYSSAYPDEYLEPSIQEFVLFGTKEECCSTYHNCQAEATTVPTPPSNGVGGAGGGSRERWYPKLVDAVPTCVRGTDYPEEVVANPDVAATFLHETRKDCCWAFPSACLRFFWHPASPGDASSGCLYGEDYLQSTVDAGHLYLTEGDCEVAMEAVAETADPNAGSESDPSPSAASSTAATSTSTSSSSSATSAATEATAGTTTVPRAEHWWPVEPVSGTGPSHCVFSDAYPGDYLHPSVRDFVLFDTKEACCEAYHNCEAQVATVPTPPNGAGGGVGAGGVREERWYPRMVDTVPSCVRGADYPAEYADPEFSAAFLFDTKLGCCGAFPSACLHFFWYPSAPGDVGGGCVYGEGYPQAVVDEGHLYVTEGECCDVWCVGTETTAATAVAMSETTVASAETTSGTVVALSTTTSTATSTTTAGVPEPCTDCVWHESITAFKTCTNSPSYPPSWDHPTAHLYFFFRTAEDCCATRFPDDCTTEDVHAVGGPGEASGGDVVGEFVPMGPRTIDNFDGDAQGLPFDFGAPNPQWIFDAAVSHSGAQSVTNIPRDGLGATADLTLKISVAHPSSIQCMAIVDTSMPYEMFYLEVNGNRRNSYHQRDQGGWFMVMTGLGPGENEIVFRVENADFEYGLLGERDERFGTGRVWLDDCEVSSM